MQRKDLALRVLSTAAIMSIVTSIAAPAFAGTYYIGKGSIDVEAITKDGKQYVEVKQGDKTYTDTSDEIVIKDGTSEADTTLKDADRAAATPAADPAATHATQELEATGSADAAGESQPDPDDAFTLNETGEDSAQNQEDSAQNQEGQDNTKEEDTPDPSTEPAPTTSADPEEKTLKTTQADTTTTPAAEEPSTALEDVKAYQPAAPTSTASSNWISVVNDCLLNKVLKIRLSNVNLKKTSDDATAPMTVDGSGNTTIELDGNNVLDASQPAWNCAAGLEKKGTGTLTITDTEEDGTQNNALRGSLTATGSWGAWGGAGIGSRGTEDSNEHPQTENITIAGNAYVKAYGQGNASGIGGGYGGNAKNITIKDNAYVVANGGGAGIGSGIGGGSSDVKIQGGTVVAEGSYTGIGGHCRGSDTSETSTIEISGGTVYANGQYGRDGVSIGSVGGNSEITISGNAKVKNIGQMGSYGASKAEAEKINATITIKDNAMIADDSGGIGGNTNTNITIQDNAVIGNLRKSGPRPNEWSGYIGTCTSTSDRIYDAKATVQIKDNVLIKDVVFIGGKYITSDVKIKIQDNAHIKKIAFGSMYPNTPAIGSDYGKVDVTIGGSSDPNKPQQGTVRIDYAEQNAGYRSVIGSGSGGGKVSIEGNVDLNLVRTGSNSYKVDYVKGDTVVTPEQLRDMIGKDSKIYLRNDRTTGNLENIVHGKNVCAHVTGEETGRKQNATCTEDGWVEYRCNYEHENGATGNSCDRIWTEKVPALGHDFTVKESEMPATCERAGTIVWKCSRCNETKTETIPALDHLWKEDHRTGNCGVAGDIYYVCERDSRHTKTEHVEATGNHRFNAWHQTKAPTCMEEGEEQHECEVCGKPETRKVDKLDHVEELRGAKEPTCTEPGYTGDKWCTRGDHLLEKGSVIPATGHHWKDNGDGTHTCPDCGATEGQPFNTNSALELRVVDAEGMDQPFTVSQNGTLRTYTGAYDTATLTGDLNTLRYLQDHGAQTIQFVTNGQTSSFDINDLLAQGSGSEVFYLTHRGTEEPTLLLVEADHSDLVKD